MADFGTGYSSLSYFRQFPFDKVKIDQSFVRDMAAKSQALAVVQAVVGLGRGLGMPVVAEDVETAAQLDVLRAELRPSSGLRDRPARVDRGLRRVGRGSRCEWRDRSAHDLTYGRPPPCQGGLSSSRCAGEQSARSGTGLSSLQLTDIRKSFGGTPVLDGVSLDMDAAEFIAFLGPSGCGKSTLLRIIAGLEFADEGEVRLEGRRIDQLPPGDRGVAMVFQHYALYPHMTVRENMAFGLRIAKVPMDEIAARVAEAARVLEIEPHLDKKPGQMSGGQRQRVAIGRAIVKHPKLFLLDEPLSNLDAALRMRTRIELAQLHQRVDAAVIMVTHDQAEAMTLADRIVVMHDRRIQQVGPPMEVYSRPANSFVARFVGSPAMNMLPAELLGGATTGGDGFARVRLGDGTTVDTRVPLNGFAGGSVHLGLRPEGVRVAAGASGAAAEVELVERLGDRTLVYAHLADGSAITGEDEGLSRIRVGDRVNLAIDGGAAHLFDASGAGHHAAERSA